jgi:hypothetical protein
MSAPQISGKSHRDALTDIGTALLQVKNARGLTLAEMAYSIRKSDDQLARYIAGDMEMGVVAWMLAVEEWPEIVDKLNETAAEREFRARQRALDLEQAQRRDKAA